MLTINIDDVCSIIQLAHQFHAKESVVFPEDDDAGGEDWAMQVLADHGSDPTYQELKYEIEALSPADQLQLVVLMWIGRGDFSAAEWDDAVREAAGARGTNTAGYLIGTPLVADYLEEALAEFGHSCNED
ncbi:MAG: DUF3775 domain-containing protein [Gammaproteobacteria bacterium]|nr:DUF3775 domain-containing protein [Gammaproteobacteria bacterium]